ncbi:Hsp20/alpha crystallin family protein [Halocalculus aciditolerans]|uniref:SHSP domain-containing protein n=1 Tax=Halocalculus aciditolerans TaxID=1383812 RepID=A0A830F371_9EURY|nr:Hsp20/alpha crystallin family protein [Halocalculus aciditolerans]GGL58289.1 hypothetical protein GCM10009039_15680 [Halocalculus aciditolerans]
MVNRSFDEMDRLFDRMDRMMMDVRERFDATANAPAVDARPGAMDADASRLHATWHAEADEHVLVLDVPGFEKSDFDVRVDDGTLAVTAEREVDDPAAGAWSTRRVHERLTLPSDATGDGVTATYRNGVLELRFPRSDSTGTRIDVE